MASANVGELQIALKFDSNSLDKSTKQAESKILGFGDIAKNALITKVVQQGFDVAVNAAKNFAGEIVNTGMKFESSMSEVAAISGATGNELAMLEQTARDFGAKTQFSASEAAQALKYMALAGWDANQSASALGGVLDLAAASGMDLAQASDMVTDYLSAFGMEANQSAYFADLLSYAQANSNTTAEQLGEAYKNCAANLNAAGQDVETTTSLLAMMANQGLKGSEAGTALNAVMRDMTAKMKDGAIAIGDTAIQVMDANGNYRDMTDILTDVESATQGMGDAERAAALASTFTADSIKGMNLIMNAGVGEAAAFEEALRGSEGTAKAMADTMNNNLEGKLKSLNSKFEELQLKLYDAVSPALSAGADALSGLADGISWAIDNANILLPILGGLATAFVTYQLAVNGASIVMGIASAATNVMAIAQGALNAVMMLNPIGLIVAAIVGLIAAIGLLWINCEDFRNFIIGIFENIGQFLASAGEAIGQFFSNLGQWFAELPGNIATWVGEALNNIGVWVGDMVNKAIELGTQFLASIGEFFSQLPYNLGKFLTTALLTVAKFVVDMIAKAVEVGTQFLQNIVNFFTQLPGRILEFITTAFNNVVNWAGQMANKAQEAGSQFLQNVVNFIQQLPGKIWNFLTDIIGKVASFVGDFVNKAREAGQNFFNTIVDEVGKIPGKMISIGGDIVRGIWNGISGAAGWIKDQIAGFCSGVVDGIKEFFGIHSPSTLFRDEVGKFMAEGIGVGFADEMENVSAEMAESVELPNMSIDSYGGWTEAVIGLTSEDNASEPVDSGGNVEITQYNTIENGFDVEQMNAAMMSAMRGV